MIRNKNKKIESKSRYPKHMKNKTNKKKEEEREGKRVTKSSPSPHENPIRETFTRLCQKRSQTNREKKERVGIKEEEKRKSMKRRITREAEVALWDLLYSARGVKIPTIFVFF